MRLVSDYAGHWLPTGIDRLEIRGQVFAPNRWRRSTTNFLNIGLTTLVKISLLPKETLRPALRGADRPGVDTQC